MVAVKEHELIKKERIVNELIQEKHMLQEQLNSKPSTSQEELEKYKNMIKSLKLEKEELLKHTAGGTKTVGPSQASLELII